VAVKRRLKLRLAESHHSENGDNVGRQPDDIPDSH